MNRHSSEEKFRHSLGAAETNDSHLSSTVAAPQLEALHESRIWRASGVLQKARENLDADILAPHLADDAVYDPKNVDEPVAGKDNVLEHLQGVFDALRNLRDPRDDGSLLSARVDLPDAADHPCLIFVSDGKRQALWVVSVDGVGKISRIDIVKVAPTPDEAVLV